MPFETDLGTDVIYGEPAGDIVSEWKNLVEMQRDFSEPFSMFWVAGPDNKTALAINHIVEQLGIDRESIIDFEISPTESDLTNRLLKFADRVRLIRGNRVMMVARGFEGVLAKTTDPYRLSRAGHDWDQAVLEDSENTKWGKLYRVMNKHVAIVTTIRFSAGLEAYNNAVKSAVSSQFKSGILELK